MSIRNSLPYRANIYQMRVTRRYGKNPKVRVHVCGRSRGASNPNLTIGLSD